MKQLDFTQPAKRARARAQRGIERAAIGAETKRPGWHENALEAVRKYAVTHGQFMTEDVRAGLPWSSVDGRAWGAVMKEAERRGWIARDGYAPANSSNRSPKRRWRSKLRRT